MEALVHSKSKAPLSVHYFRLCFQNDGPFLMKLNELGVRFRCSVFGIPFGDQGFFMHRRVFERVGGYPLNLSYGEDHAFVWLARALGYKLNEVPADLRTSARKYRDKGWRATTISHISKTFWQAAPYFWSSVKRSIF